MPKLSIKHLDLKSKRVFVRVDFNVPLKEGKVDDDTRVRAALPTIQYAIENNDDNFAQQLAKLSDRLYVNDAFGAAHRAHASTVGITKYVDKAAAGLLMEKELTYLGRVITNPDHPFVAILGGAKVSDKIPVINALIHRKVDKILIGGEMAWI